MKITRDDYLIHPVWCALAACLLAAGAIAFYATGLMVGGWATILVVVGVLAALACNDQVKKLV